MTAAATIEEFFAQPDDDLDTPTPTGQKSVSGDPIAAIADCLRRVTEIIERRDAEDVAEEQQEANYAELLKEYDELEQLHDKKQALIEQVLETVKPSSSKLANAIRALLEPPVTSEPAGEPEGRTPDIDAPVEEWRAHAHSQGYNGADIDTMNRSQIRTMLGLPQITGEPEGGTSS